MREPVHPEAGVGRSRAERRRGRAKALARRRQWLSDREAYLASSLEPGERVIARSGSDPLVTDRRILTARQLRDPSSGNTWVLDPLAFDQIVGWSTGEQHDGRPILRLTHHPQTRIAWAPARRFLWWTWGNALGPVVETTTTLTFGRRTNPVFRAIGAELDRRNVPEGTSFVIRPAGTRAQRTRGSRGPLRVYRRSGRIGRLRHRATLFFFVGGLAWPLRPLSWIVVAALAWLASPWLVLPAIVASELAWLVVMRWSSPGRRTVPTTDVDPTDQPAP
jgi:hypothetical protein